MTPRFRRPMPAWMRKRVRARAAAATDRFNTRLGTLIDAVSVDVIWSNDTRCGYHPECSAAVPLGPIGAFALAFIREDPRAHAACGGCGRPLDEEARP